MAAERQNRRDIQKAQGIANPLGPRLLPLKTAAQYLGLSLWALRERCWSGDLPVIRFPGGRKVYLDVNDLEKFIEESKTIL
jgi:hypothetical protein